MPNNHGGALKIGVYGGSFNPPHVGHAMVSGWLLWTGLVDEVWLVPTFKHAFSKNLSSFQDRVAMCEAMAKDVDPRIKVCRIEKELPTPSFTLNTLKAIQKPGFTVRLVVGADVLEQVGSWYKWEEIQKQFSPIIVGRSGYNPIEGVPTFPLVSSSEIRDRLAKNLDVSYLLTNSVHKLIGTVVLNHTQEKPCKKHDFFV